MSLSKENQWKYLSIASTVVMGTYFLVDFLAKRREKAQPTRARGRSTLTIQTDNLEEVKKSLDYVTTPTIIQNKIYSTDFHYTKPENIPVYKICLTGGPCAGKTTSLAFLTERLTERGFRVFTVPETPTMTVQGGGMIIMGGLSPENVMKFQTYLMKMQMKMEDYFMELAVMSGEPSVVLCDRGVLDPYAYMSDECWHSILDEQGWSMVILRDRRYDAVIHLVTAADGAEEYYTLENNQARYESAETAIKVDRRTQLAWIGHPNFAIVDNTLKGFQNKLNKVLGAVSNFLKLDFSTKIFEKYLVEKFVLPESIRREVFQVEESFLVAEGDSTGKKRHKIRKRTQNSICSYMHSMRIFNESKNFHEVKKNITAREYMLLISKKDEDLITTIKTRTSFIWENQSMMVDEFQNTAEKATVLKISVLEKGEKVKVPEFIKIIKNITDDPQYSTYALAHKRD